MTRAEQLFLPLYLFIKAVAYLYLVMRLLPAAALALLLGYASRRLMWPRAWKTLTEWRLAPGGIRTVLLLWEAVVLAVSIFLGGEIGWWIFFMQKERILGGCVGALGFLLGYFLAYKQNKEV